MMLLFDANLSRRLVDELAAEFPGSAHVGQLGLERADDEAVWDHAKANALVIVSKDADFTALATLHDHPPKVIWLRLGNCTTAEVAHVLRSDRAAIQSFARDPDAGILEIFPAQSNS